MEGVVAMCDGCRRAEQKADNLAGELAGLERKHDRRITSLENDVSDLQREVRTLRSDVDKLERARRY